MEKSNLNSEHVYEIADGKKSIDSNKSYIHICKSHKSHAVSVGAKLIILKSFKKNSDEYKNVYYLFMYAFSLLQNSINLQMFVEYFKDICIVFGSKYKTKDFDAAFSRLNQALKTRPTDQEEFEVIYISSLKAIEEAEASGIDLEKDCDEDEVKKAKETFKSNSKFYIVCLETFNEITKKVYENDEIGDNELNSLYLIKLVVYLLEKHIGYAAWWSRFTYSDIDLNANNGRLEVKIKEKKKEIEVGHQPDIYVNKSLSLIKGI
jgi:hypothetical protein